MSCTYDLLEEVFQKQHDLMGEVRSLCEHVEIARNMLSSWQVPANQNSFRHQIVQELETARHKCNDVLEKAKKDNSAAKEQLWEMDVAALQVSTAGGASSSVTGKAAKHSQQWMVAQRHFGSVRHFTMACLLNANTPEDITWELVQAALTPEDLPEDITQDADLWKAAHRRFETVDAFMQACILHRDSLCHLMDELESAAVLFAQAHPGRPAPQGSVLAIANRKREEEPQWGKVKGKAKHNWSQQWQGEAPWGKGKGIQDNQHRMDWRYQGGSPRRSGFWGRCDPY